MRGNKCSDVMTSDLTCCLPDDSVHVVAQSMKAQDVGAMPVIDSHDKKRLIGIVTDRDLALKVVAENRDAGKTKVEDVMSRNMVACKTGDSWQIALDSMAKHQLRRIPVVDQRRTARRHHRAGRRRHPHRAAAPPQKSWSAAPKRPAACREEASGLADVDVRDEQPFFAVGLVAEQRPVGAHHRRSGRRSSACEVDGCEIAGVFGGAAQGRFLVERVRRIGESRRHVAARLGLVEVRVEHDLRAVPRGPADRFRIAPAFMADRDAKRQRTGLENPPAGPERIGSFLGRVDLDFVLETGDGSVRD